MGNMAVGFAVGAGVGMAIGVGLSRAKKKNAG